MREFYKAFVVRGFSLAESETKVSHYIRLCEKWF